MNSLRLLPLIAIIFLVACQPNTKKAEADASEKKDTKPKAVVFKFNPKVGDKYYSMYSSEVTVTTTNGKAEAENIILSEIGTYYEILPGKDSLGRQLKITYDKMRIGMGTRDDGVIYTVTKGSKPHNPLEKILSTSLGQSLIVDLSPAGEIGEITGIKEIVDKMIKGLGAMPENISKSKRKEMERYMGENFIREMITASSILPAGGADVGDMWSGKHKSMQNLTFNVSATYVLSSLSGDTAKVTVSSDIDSAKIDDNLAVGNAQMKLAGTENGTYYIDTKSGMIVNQTITTTVEGETETRGKKTPIKVRSYNQVMLKKE